MPPTKENQESFDSAGICYGAIFPPEIHCINKMCFKPINLAVIFKKIFFDHEQFKEAVFEEKA